MTDDQRQLLDFLDRSVFGPILSACVDRFDGRDHARLHEVQRRTADERERYRRCVDAEDVARRFHADLARARRVQQLRSELGMPRLRDVRERFDELCDRLGVAARV